MKPQVRVRELTAEERQALEQGLRSSKSFELRRSQIVLASARGESVAKIASFVGCDDQTVRNAIHAFNQQGIAALQPQSRRPHQTHEAFDEETAEKLKALLHQSPRRYGKATSLWTLELAAEVSYEQGLTAEMVSDETIRRTIRRLGWNWRRAKQWISSPDPAYEAKKNDGIG